MNERNFLGLAAGAFGALTGLGISAATNPDIELMFTAFGEVLTKVNAAIGLWAFAWLVHLGLSLTTK